MASTCFGGKHALRRDATQVGNERRPPSYASRAQGLGKDQVGLNEDFMPTQQARKSELWPLFKEAKAASKRAFWRAIELFVIGTQIYLPSSI
jgi:hypothetical protein